jgi:dihydrofolate reductase
MFAIPRRRSITMRKLGVFNQVSLDGYFTDARGDMSWAHKHDPEWQSFTAENASGEAVLLFGRVTYELMAGYWPTPVALEQNRAVAERMNALQKVVFSRSLESVSWTNTRLIRTDIVTATRELKTEPAPDLLIMGSGTIVSQLTEAGLIDEYQIVVNPIVLGDGRTMFSGVRDRREFRLDRTRTFRNGNLVLWYRRS